MQVQAAALIWLLFLISGLGLVAYSSSSNIDEFKNSINLWQTKLHHCTPWIVSYVILSCAQCAMFSMRTYTKSMSDIELYIEWAACVMHAVEFILYFLHDHLGGIFHGLKFMVTGAVVDCLLMTSVALVAFIEVDGQKTWFSFSFLAGLHFLGAWPRLLFLFRVNLQVLHWQTVNVVVRTLTMVFLAAMMMMSLENLGEPQMLEELNQDEWNFISSWYYIIVTISTVGYGDMVPVTGIGRIFAIVSIFGGIAGFLLAMHKIVEVISLNGQGRGSYSVKAHSRHVIVSGNPGIQMAKDVIAELFHSDHADDADDLNVVFLFPSKSDAMGALIQYLAVTANISLAQRICVKQGSVLDVVDLQRVSAVHAVAFFILPDMLSEDHLKEDTENIIRMMAVMRFAPAMRMILLLLKAEHKQLLFDAGVGLGSGNNLTCLAFDEFKMELIGKTCQVAGFCTLIGNLCKTIDPGDTEGNPRIWQREYDRGIGNELYEVELSSLYADRNATFCEVVLDVLQQTEGSVYLIGLVETNQAVHSKRVLVNPGPLYAVKKPLTTGVHTSGIFIAPDREAVVQCESGQIFRGRQERPQAPSSAEDTEFGGATAERDALRAAGATKAGHTLPEANVDEQLLLLRGQGLSRPQQERAGELVRLSRQHLRAATPARPSLKQLAKGGHIIVCCVDSGGSRELRLGIGHFVRPLRQNHITHLNPIVVLSQNPPKDWQSVAQFREVYYLNGSPLSLFDLERANFRDASAIFICRGSSTGGKLIEPWMADSQLIFCSRLIESHLPVGSSNVILELTSDTNHRFVALPGISGKKQKEEGEDEDDDDDEDEQSGCCGGCRSLCCGCLRRSSVKAVEEESHEEEAALISEYYRQPRFASGQLFIGNVVTSLAVNTFFNPSLWDLVSAMVATRVVMMSCPKDWIGKSYFEFFDHLLYNEQLMAIGIFRIANAVKAAGRATAKVNAQPSGKEGPKWSYVYCAPPAKETTMNHGDRVICFAVSDRVAAG